jgi:hypothetical protein
MSAAEKPQSLCDPSQNGLDRVWPQRHSATDRFPVGS